MTVAARSRRDDILRAAEAEFSTAGFAGGRIERIAASAGVNKQLPFHYFRSKEGLFAATVARLFGPSVPPAAGDSPSAVIRAALADVLRTLRAAPGLVGILADARANPEFPPDALRHLARWRDQVVARLAAALEDGQRRGWFRDDFDPAVLARVALAAALGSVAWEPVAEGEGDPISTLILDACAWR